MATVGTCDISWADDTVTAEMSQTLVPLLFGLSFLLKFLGPVSDVH